MGHLPTNHDVGRVKATLHPQNAAQGTVGHKSCCTGCYTAPRWWKNFSSIKRMFSWPFSACHWRRRSALVRRISFTAGVRWCLFECRCAVMCRSSLMSCDIDPGDTVSSTDKDFCFRNGLRRIRSRAVLITPLVLPHLGRPDRALSSTPQSSSQYLIAR